MNGKAFNSQSFIEFLCYSVFAGLIFFLLSSGKYLSYVTPRMEPYLYFSVVVMVIWALAGLGSLFRPQHRIRSAHCFVLAIPILLLLLPHSPLSTADLSGNYSGGNAFLGLSGGSSNSGSSSSVAPSPEGTDDSLSTDAALEEDGYPAVPPGLDEENRKIVVENNDFGAWISELYSNMEKYTGYTISITGFVFKDSEFIGEGEFVPARLMMSCCVADLTPAGLLSKYDKASGLKEDDWITVEGTLFIGSYEYDGVVYDEPRIDVTKITPAEPVEGYVYPY